MWVVVVFVFGAGWAAGWLAALQYQQRPHVPRGRRR